MARVKKYTTHKGKRCSGYGVFPNGEKCSGCSDCNGKPMTEKQIQQYLDNKVYTIKKRK